MLTPAPEVFVHEPNKFLPITGRVSKIAKLNKIDPNGSKKTIQKPATTASKQKKIKMDNLKVSKNLEGMPSNRLDPLAVCNKPSWKLCILHSLSVSMENPGVAKSGPENQTMHVSNFLHSMQIKNTENVLA